MSDPGSDDLTADDEVEGFTTEPGTHTVTVTVYDDDGGSCDVEVTYTIIEEDWPCDCDGEYEVTTTTNEDSYDVDGDGTADYEDYEDDVTYSVSLDVEDVDSSFSLDAEGRPAAGSNLLEGATAELIKSYTFHDYKRDHVKVYSCETGEFLREYDNAPYDDISTSEDRTTLTPFTESTADDTYPEYPTTPPGWHHKDETNPSVHRDGSFDYQQDLQLTGGLTNDSFGYWIVAEATNPDTQATIRQEVGMTAEFNSLVDLDIDSDNDDALAPPTRSPEEEKKETSSNQDESGKVVLTNIGDSDTDGVPDFADGIKELGTAGTPDGGRFVPLVMDIAITEEFDPEDVLLTFTYNQSDPQAITNPANADFPPPNGSIRIWVKDGDKARSWNSVADDGDFVRSGQNYDLTDFTHDDGSVITLFVEGINAGTSTIRLTAEIDGERHADTVKITVLDWELDLSNRVDADYPDPYASLAILGLNDDEDDVPEIRGAEAEFELIEDDVVVDSGTDQLNEVGTAAIDFETSTNAGDEYKVRAHLLGTTRIVDDITIVAGAPAAIELNLGQESLVADGTSEKTIVATVRDQYGNLVQDGTDITFSVSGLTNDSLRDIVSREYTTTNGRASVRIRSSVFPKSFDLTVTAGDFTTRQEIPVSEVSLSLSGPTQLNLATGESGTFTVITNAANGTPVEWLISSGNNGQTSVKTVVTNGQAVLQVPATGPNARVGLAFVAATVGGVMRMHSFSLVSTSKVQLLFDRPALSGDVVDDGTETLTHNVYNRLPFDPNPSIPPVQIQVPYYAKTNATILGKPNGVYYVDFAQPQQSALARFLGLDPNGAIILDGQGRGIIQLESRGALTNRYANLELRVTGEDPDTGQSTERVSVIPMTEHTAWTRTWDVMQSFVGGDPQTPAGIASNAAGGMFAVADAGSIVKNVWRSLGLSSQQPDYLEASLSGLGLLTEVAVGAGEIADAPISGLRAVLAAVRGTKFSDVLHIFWRRALSNADEMRTFAAYLAKLVSSETIFRVSKEVFTSDELLKGGMKLGEEFGDEFYEGLKVVGVSTSGGIEAAQRITQVLSDLPNASPAFVQLKALATTDATKFRAAMEGFGKALTEGGIDPQLISKILQRDEYFTGSYTVADALVDLGKTARANGFEKLAKSVANGAPGLGVPASLGKLYELRVAAHYADEVGADKITVLQWITTASGKTDIDIIADGVYTQIKRTGGAFAKRNDVAQWVRKAEEHGATRIRYVTRPGETPRQRVMQFLEDKAIQIIPVAGP